ncbi:AarF/ABC1/UbiB kinase family protein [Pelagibius litoralis]|uniref:AarF/ABC1/UbiB kinase family protein n=1 Tax=Pelagibius litoralis TaxID=374515 RepID=A0A967CCK4_9PROT|nr:AarF/ABC1/UbiB kinase family protein [Pelagibius litoralis]NIA69133.1 AarF/ABC1/UbiB kinase family protein [Pelagibius litoralis]
MPEIDDENQELNEADTSRLSGRMRRYAKVGTSVGGLAAQVVGARYLGIGLDRGKHSSDLKAALGGLKGPLMKAAQILATIPDALPKEYAEELRQLQSNAPSMGWPFVKRRMRAELGLDWQKRFQSFEHEAAAAASLGQVHRAVGPDGRDLACKLQYPDMLSAVEADLQQLKILFGIYRRYDKAIDPSNVYHELAERLREELDYEREGRHMLLYKDMLSDEAGVHIADLLPELSTQRLLTMTWLEGKPLLDFVKGCDSVEQRNAVAMNMFRCWYVPFYYYGIIHGDPHLGNYTIRQDGTVNLLDFGCIRVFPPVFVKGVIDLYFALERDDPELAVEAYRTWGFDNISKDLLAALNLWAAFLYAPLLEDKPQRIMGDKGSLYGAEVAGEVHKELRRLGGVTPPREFVLMDRAAVGLGSVFMHLDAEINWHRMFHELISGFDVDALEKRQAKVLKAQKLPLPE